MFGGLLEKERKLVDINLAVTVQSPRLLQESTWLTQYCSIVGVTRNPPIHQIHFRANISGCTVHP